MSPLGLRVHDPWQRLAMTEPDDTKKNPGTLPENKPTPDSMEEADRANGEGDPADGAVAT